MDEYKAKIEVVLGNDNRADMTLKGNINGSAQPDG